MITTRMSIIDGNNAPVGKNLTGHSYSFKFQEWLNDHPNIPGARFVELLKQYLHSRPGAEAEQLTACASIMRGVAEYDDSSSNSKLAAHCFADSGSSAEATDADADNGGGERGAGTEKATFMPLMNKNNNNNNSPVTVYELRRFQDTDRIIHRLGLDPLCLPSLLAGAAVQDAGVVASELGTYVGLTSRCLGMGL